MVREGRADDDTVIVPNRVVGEIELLAVTDREVTGDCVGTNEVDERGDVVALGLMDSSGETDAEALNELLPVTEPEVDNVPEGEAEVDCEGELLL